MNNKSARTNEELTNTNNSLRELNQQLLSEIAERKRIEEALAESEAHFRTLANNGQALIWTSGTDKKCNYFNQPWLNFTGRALEEEIGDGWTEGVHPDDFDHCVSTYINAFEKREKFSMEYRVRHVSGEYRWIQDDGTPRYNIKGEFIGYIGHCLDIQERKLMDLELQESKKLFSKAEAIGHIGSWEYNIQTSHFWGSDEAKKIYGFDPDKDDFSVDEVESCIPERNRVHQALVDLIDEGKKYKLEFEIITKNTAEHRIIGSIAELEYDEHDKPLCVVGVIQDITARKKTENELQKSENRFRSFVENANDIVYSLSTDGIFTYVSPNWTEILGHEIDEIIDQPFAKFIHPDDFQTCQNAIIQSVNIGKKLSGIEYRVQHKNGSWKWHSSNTSTIRNSNGEISLLMGIAHDITDRKQFEFALKESEKRLQMIMEVTKTGFWDWNLETDEWYASPMYYTMLGYEPISGLSDRKIWLSRIHPDDRDQVAKKINSALSGKGSEYTYECRMLHADGNYRWHSVQGYVTAHNQQGKPTRMLGTRIDISESKHSEELLRRSNRELRAISSCNQLLIHANDEQNLINEVCNIICDEAGYHFVWIGFIEKNKEKIVRPVAWAGHEDGYLNEAKITWSEDSKYGLGPTGQAIRDKKTCYIQDLKTEQSFAPWTKIATKREYRSIISMPLKDRSKNVFGVMNIYSSETNAFTDNEIRLLNELSDDLAFGILSLRLRNAHKQIEETLFESEEKYRNLVEASMDAIYINKGNAITYLNPAALRLFGAQTPEQIIGKSPFDIIHPDYHQFIKERISTLVDDDIPVPILEEKVVQLNGNIIDVEVAASPFSLKGQRAIQVVMRDISERKQFERTLIESKALYHSFVEHLPASVFRKDAKGRYIFVNSLFCKLKGLREEEIIGLTPYELQEYESKDKSGNPHGIMGVQYNLDNQGILQHEQIMNTGLPIEQIEQYPQPDGTTLYFQVIKSPVFDAEGKVIGSQGVQFDITERILAEEKVRESEQLFANIFYNSPVSICITSRDNGKIIDANKVFLKDLGFTCQEIIGKSIADIGIFNDQIYRDQLIAKLIKDGSVSMFECPFRTKTGRIMHGLMSMTSILYKGKPHQLTTVIDITDRKLAEIKLLESERLLNESQRISGIGSYTLDIEKGLWTGSIVLDEIFGISPTDDHSVAGWLAIVHPEDKEMMDNYFFIKVIAEKGRFDKEYRIVPKNNPSTFKWVHGIGEMERNSSGVPIKMIGTIQDITEKKLAEEKINYHRTLLDEMGRVAKIGGWEFNCKTGKGTWTDEVAKIHELEQNNETSVEIGISFYRDESRARIEKAIDNAIKHGTPYNLEIELTTANGNHKWVQTIGHPLFENGKVVKIQGSFQDITDRKKTEEQLLKLTRAIEQSPDTIVITNTKGEIEYVNPGIEEKTGYSISELIGENPKIFSSGQTKTEEYEEMWSTISKGQIWHGELLNKKKNGEPFWESTTISPVFDIKGVITHYLAIKEDITQQKKMTQELIEAKEKAEESDRLKSAFLANMSHEIRTPLNSILGFASLMPDEKSLDLISNYAQIVVQNSEQLVSLIDGIVLYSKLQTHLMSCQPTLFNAGKLLRDVQVSFALPEYSKDIELRTEIYGEIQVSSDYDKIRQILSNLISNAFKYTKKGSIIIGCKSNEDEIKFWVKDTGIGIPENEITKIFDRFFRGSNVDLARSRGTGLGLSIVKELVELLNGKIWAESEVGKGSTFYFTIPLKKEIN